MKRLNKYMMLFVAALALVSCVDDVVDTPSTEINAKVGDEVQFGLSLPSARTVYGAETNGAFPIYWVEGDKVQIFSPQASKNNAEYKVILPTKENSTEVIDKPNYAKDLQITGDHGVQWGEGYTYTDGDNVEHTGVHNFYSIYPSSNEYTFELDDPEGDPEEEIVYAKNVKVATFQEVLCVEKDANGNPKFQQAMSNCLMSAVTPAVDMEDGVVNLKYTPLSTVLWVTLAVDAQSTQQESLRTNFTLLGIQLEAKTNIAGTFDLDMSEGIVNSFIQGSDKISLSFTDETTTQHLNYTIKAGQSISFPIFLAPVDGLDINGWKITVNTDQGTFVKTLEYKDGAETELLPGQIHKVTLPNLAPTSTGWDVSKWMTYIPRNVYLSEISIPGSWNSLSKDAQGDNPSIQTQYANGVRAFHLDTRWKRTGNSGSYKYNTLGIANGGNTTNVSGKKVMTDSNNPLFTDILTTLTDADHLKTDEYMVLVCSFAADSYESTDSNGNDWVNVISNACATNADVYDAKKLNANTLVGDVLGKLIVIVNIENSNYSSYPANSKCLFMNMPMKTVEGDFDNILNNRIGTLNKATTSATPAASGITMYHTHAQASIRQDNIPYSGSGDRDDGDRGWMPTRGERKREVENILNWSKGNYGTSNYAHDKWIYLGLGGYYVQWNNGLWGIGAKWEEISSPNITIAEDFNPWINTKVTDMKGTADAPYYPVGIVFMNYVNSYKDAAVKNILMLNNKYRLQYDPNKPADYKPAIDPNDSTVTPGGGII